MKIHALAFVLCAAASQAAPAQETLPAPQGVFVPAVLESGKQANALPSVARAFAGEVGAPGASWIRVHFASATLSPESFVVITSLLDGDFQVLDATSLAQWENASAYLNGPRARVELFLGPGAIHDRVRIERVEASSPVGEAWTSRGAAGQSGICGQDDRVPSLHNAAARLMPIGCSGTIVCEDSTVLSAGHCYAVGLVLQFNVPNSTSACAPTQPPVVDQFPLTPRRADSFGPGADWFVLSAGVNSLGQTPYQRYGLLRRPATIPAAIGNPVEAFGYGHDTTCTRDLTQQRSYGEIVGVTNTWYELNADVRSGSSGSALLSNGQVIGIITHGSGECVNIATRIDLTILQNALRTAMTCDDPVTLSVDAGAPSASIQIAPPDLAGQSDGTGTFQRAYTFNSSVHLTAPATSGGQCFQHWIARGIDMGPNPTLTLTLNGNASARAVFASICCASDLDDGTNTGTRDGGVTIDDLLYFLDRFESGALAADLDDDGEPTIMSPDGGVDINDLISLLARFEFGC